MDMASLDLLSVFETKVRLLRYGAKCTDMAVQQFFGVIVKIKYFTCLWAKLSGVWSCTNLMKPAEQSGTSTSTS
jgi:hypothetical protein